MATSTDPISYLYRIAGRIAVLTRVHVGTAYARNGNVGNPTQYYKWEARVDGELVTSWADRRAEAYEYARARILGIPYHAGIGPNLRGAVNLRVWTVVEREMRANYVGRQAV